MPGGYDSLYSSGHLYKMAGNAVSVPVITAIGQKIYEINADLGIVKE